MFDSIRENGLNFDIERQSQNYPTKVKAETKKKKERPQQ